eukprot:2287566-Rhodomonas_salina.1
MESECTKWSAECAENAILVHRILPSQSSVDMLQPALAGTLLSAHPAVCDAVSWGLNFDVSISMFTGVPVTRDSAFQLEQLINARPAPLCNMQCGSGAKPFESSAPPGQSRNCASFAPELSSSGAVNPLADVGNAANQYNNLLLRTQKQAKELEELKRQWAAVPRGSPAVMALQDLLSVFENFVPAAGSGCKESSCASGWNSYALMEQHSVSVYCNDPEDLSPAISRSTLLLHLGADAEPGLLAWASVLQDKQHTILLDMNEGRQPEKFASAEANFFKIINELLQTSKVCEIKAGLEGAEEGRNRQLADFAMVFNQAQEHMRNHAEVMGCGDVMYSQNMCMLVCTAFGTAMDVRHMKKMKVTAELHESIRKIYEPKPSIDTPGWGGCGGGGGSNGGSEQPLGENVRGNGRKNSVHAPNAAELVRGVAWAVEKKAKCNRCGEGFHHEFFECPAVLAEVSGGFDMQGWSI